MRPGRNQLRRNLNWCLLIFRVLILVARLDDGTPSLAAAPNGPETRPLVSASACSMISFSVRESPTPLGRPDSSTGEWDRVASLESHNSSTARTSPWVRITDLSIVFCSSLAGWERGENTPVGAYRKLLEDFITGDGPLSARPSLKDLRASTGILVAASFFRLAALDSRCLMAGRIL